MGRIILFILFMAVAIYISNRRTAATPAGTPAEPSGNRRVRQKAATSAPTVMAERPILAENQRPLAAKRPAPHTPLLDSSREGESVTGFASSTATDSKPQGSAPKSSASTAAAAAHYARWRKAVIDATVLTPLQ